MGLPEWCQTHSLKEFLQLMEEDTHFVHTKNKKKGKNMNDANITDQGHPVVAAEGTPEFLKAIADKLASEGEVIVQTDKEVGANPQPITVH